MIRAALFVAAAISVVTTILIVVALLKESIPFFKDVGASFFSDAEWSPLFSDPQFGIRQLIVGTPTSTSRIGLTIRLVRVDAYSER